MNRLKTTASLACVVLAALASAQNIRTTVNGENVYFPDVQPTMINGRVMVPLRGVFEHMGAHVMWNSATQTVIVQNAQKEIRLPIGSMTAYVSGTPVSLDSPAVLRSGRTMVPLRFTSEAFDASVDWIAETRTVAISTTGVSARPSFTNIPEPRRETPVGRVVNIPANTVIPFTLDTKLTSNGSRVGDRFTATLDPPNGSDDYQGLPAGTKLVGRVDTVKAKSGNTPGVIGLEFVRVRLPNGTTAPIDGSLIGLDNKSVVEENGRLVARSEARNDNLKYVGYGAGAGLLLSILGKGDALTNALIGGALGFLFGEIQRSQQRPRDVTLDVSNRFGVRLTNELVVRATAAASQR